MIKIKYYDGIRAAQRCQHALGASPRFDLQRLHAKGLRARIASAVLEDYPRPLLSLVRRFRPNLRIGKFLLVTKNADVREVLERQEEFETPYGLEMAEIAGGSNFILGMQDGQSYRRMKSSVLSAFPVEEVEEIVRPIAARHSQEIMLKAAPGFDAVRDLLRIVPVRICRAYFGMVIDDEAEFADWSIALSTLFFSDFFGNPVTRELAVAAADHMIEAIQRSIAAIRDGRTSAKTPLGRLVAMHDRKQLSLGDVQSIMMGMIAGFVPTNLLASGNCLDVVLSRPEARQAVEAAIAAKDNEQLAKAILESMRFKPIWIGPLRYTTRDTVIAKGTKRERLVRAGTTVMPATLSAMFDEDAVSRPNEFDLNRSHREYMVFGHGIHCCIGASLAQVQISESFRALFEKPGVRRARGKAGRLTRLGTYPENLKVDFDRSPLSETVEHSMVTIVAPVRRGPSLKVLRGMIDKLGNPARPDVAAALDATGIIHFASLAVAGKADPGEELDSDRNYLVLELSGDGPDDAVIDAFASRMEPLVREIFETACGLGSDKPLQKFMRKHAVKISPHFGSNAGLVFSGTPGHSVRRIRAEEKLENEVRNILDCLREQRARGGAEMLARVRQKLLEKQEYRWVFEPAASRLESPAGHPWQAVFRTIKAPGVALTIAALLAIGTWIAYSQVFDPGGWIIAKLLTSLVVSTVGLIILAVVLGAVAVLALRRLENRDKPVDRIVDPERFEAIVSRENFGAQNHLTAISTMKKGVLRRLCLRLTFYLVSILARTVYRPGFLDDMNSIHFARWLILPRSRQLMFFSNYGGSWESYLEDFVAKANTGLTGVWSNTEGFPRARFLFFGGASDGDRFKRWARTQQVPSLFWYSAYPKLNTGRIRINSKIRQGLAHAVTESEARDWLSLFGSLPRSAGAPPSRRFSVLPPMKHSVETLETPEIQSVFFGPLGKLGNAEMLAIRIQDGVRGKDRRAWLEFIASKTTFGARAPVERAMMVSFGFDGLKRLGLDGDQNRGVLATFPLAYRQGMANSSRSRILDDVGDSEPAKWRWGSPDAPADAVIVCYANTPESLSKDVAELEKRTDAAGLDVVARIPLTLQRKKSGKAVEHFGFVDGVSQPIIKGTPRAFATQQPMHLIAPGEFLFGYRDELGFYPPTPSVPASFDPGGILPAVQSNRPSSEENMPMRDLGRNGSFLVVRQFEQHTDRFAAYCKSAAREKAAESGNPEITPRWIAAKMIGRWPDGTSLVRNPGGRPGLDLDNDFSFGTEDPQGLRCPLGAHIRRSYPRDSLGEDRETQIKIGKRHRILRIGRTYQTKVGSRVEKGLLFMCLNADIERQYEFMQQTWVSAGSFHGLPAEKDPTISAQNDDSRFSIPTWDGGVVLRGLPNFITTRGGGYFFIPSRSAMRYLISRL